MRFVIVLPPITGALAICGLMVAATAGHDVIWTHPTFTISEAAALGDAGTMVERLSEGADPNAPAMVRYGLPTSRVIALRPLEAAVASQDLDMVVLALRNGARVEIAGRARLICIAERRNASDIAEYLNALPGVSDAAGQTPCERVLPAW